jgi:hypothetical protein
MGCDGNYGFGSHSCPRHPAALNGRPTRLIASSPRTPSRNTSRSSIASRPREWLSSRGSPLAVGVWVAVEEVRGADRRHRSALVRALWHRRVRLSGCRCTVRQVFIDAPPCSNRSGRCVFATHPHDFDLDRTFDTASSRRAAAQVRQVAHAQALGNFPQPGSAGGEETAQQPASGQLLQPRRWWMIPRSSAGARPWPRRAGRCMTSIDCSPGA